VVDTVPITFVNRITKGSADPGSDPMLNTSASLPPAMIY